MILKIVYLVQVLMIKCWIVEIEESFNFNLPSKFSRVFKCVRFFFHDIKNNMAARLNLHMTPWLEFKLCAPGDVTKYIHSYT